LSRRTWVADLGPSRIFLVAAHPDEGRFT